MKITTARGERSWGGGGLKRVKEIKRYKPPGVK